MRNLVRPVLMQMDRTTKRWETLKGEGRVDRTRYQISWQERQDIQAQLDEIGRILEEEAIDWDNPRNRQVGRVHAEVLMAYIDLNNAHQDLIEAYYKTLTEDEVSKRRRLDEERKNEARPALVAAADVAG